jgi:D-proline reductase (dithiol) PrdB
MKTDTTVQYMERSRDYYAAHGYDAPYDWAHFDHIPFAPLKKPLAESTVTIVTTSMPAPVANRIDRQLYIGDLQNPPSKLFTDGLAWDMDATHTDDLDSFFPAEELDKRRQHGEIGNLSAHYYCVPTLYSHRRTMQRDAPAILASCVKDGVDVALLVPL